MLGPLPLPRSVCTVCRRDIPDCWEQQKRDLVGGQEGWWLSPRGHSGAQVCACVHRPHTEGRLEEMVQSGSSRERVGTNRLGEGQLCGSTPASGSCPHTAPVWLHLESDGERERGEFQIHPGETHKTLGGTDNRRRGRGRGPRAFPQIPPQRLLQLHLCEGAVQVSVSFAPVSVYALFCIIYYVHMPLLVPRD